MLRAVHMELMNRLCGRWTSDELASLRVLQNIWEAKRTFEPALTAEVFRTIASKSQAHFLTDFMVHTGSSIVKEILAHPADTTPAGQEVLGFHTSVLVYAAQYMSSVIVETSELPLELLETFYMLVSCEAPFYRTVWPFVYGRGPTVGENEMENNPRRKASSARSKNLGNDLDDDHDDDEGGQAFQFLGILAAFPTWQARLEICDLVHGYIYKSSFDSSLDPMFDIAHNATRQYKPVRLEEELRVKRIGETAKRPQLALAKLQQLSELLALYGITGMSLDKIGELLSRCRYNDLRTYFELRAFMEYWAEPLIAAVAQVEMDDTSRYIHHVVEWCASYLIEEISTQVRVRHLVLLTRLLSISTQCSASFASYTIGTQKEIVRLAEYGNFFFIIDALLSGNADLYDENGGVLDPTSREMQAILLTPLFYAWDWITAPRFKAVLLHFRTSDHQRLQLGRKRRSKYEASAKRQEEKSRKEKGLIGRIRSNWK
ncbi:Hypothetical Protein FCC1311_110602 [Hondaea fermentalgiana]|uniref:Uncharacterized protein n=1 Tax=Hondaea fermentalgiana TaxID=2315210 RepID=A0A2R5GYE9_9STRA|nr:Hypothetical Protein FCC1311_110602 [Hondaea fermentalgiana]|eukprot:GBG34838.1 Hypothetical Protein FCC1311_110602 [Hondaea fermentalgiana]